MQSPRSTIKRCSRRYFSMKEILAQLTGHRAALRTRVKRPILALGTNLRGIASAGKRRACYDLGVVRRVIPPL